MELDIGQTHALLRTFNRPGERLPQGLARDSTAGLADGHQACVSPIEGAVVLHLAHQSGVRQGDEMHVPGLAHSVPELTLAHAQVLLPVPVKGLRPGPAPLVHLEDTMRLPVGAIGDENLAWLTGVGTRPEYQNADRMRDPRQANRLRKVPLRVAGHGEFRTQERRECFDPRTDTRFLAADDHHPIGFQVADVTALLAVDVVHNRGIGEVTIEGEITGDGFSHRPVD